MRCVTASEHWPTRGQKGDRIPWTEGRSDSEDRFGESDLEGRMRRGVTFSTCGERDEYPAGPPERVETKNPPSPPFVQMLAHCVREWERLNLTAPFSAKHAY